MGMKPFKDFDTTPFKIPVPTSKQPYVPDYRPVINALKELVKAFEVIENRANTPYEVAKKLKE